MTPDDLTIARQLSAAEIGSVKVHQLDQLLFDDVDIFGSRAFKQSNVDRLLHRFDYEGCRRLDPLTWIPCEIKLSELQPLVSSLSSGDPKEIILPDDWNLHCFQGKHQIAAAREWLAPSNTWWIFNLYDAERLSDDCRRRLRECDSRSHTFTDGEIFRNIRHYQQRDEIDAAKEWLARWSPTKCGEFNRIYEPKGKSQDEFRCLGRRLDALLCFPALWTPWHMGTHLPSLKCPEELSDFLAEIRSAWQSFTCQNSQFLDPSTLAMLEGRCPRLSMADYQYIKNAFQDGSAFSMVNNPTLRSKMQHAVLGYRKIIPSLRTFLENTKYLKAMTDVVKKILPVNFKGTIRQAMFRYYVAPRNQQFYIQSLENKFVQKVGPKDFGFWSAYRQLFLFAMRHFCGMTDSQPLGFSQSSRARCLDRSELWQRLRLLISKIGFVIPGSKFNPGTNYLEFTAILSLLTRLRPPELFEYEENQMSEWSTKVASFLGSMTPRVATIPVPIQTCDRSEDWSLQSRCGMTDTESFFWIKNTYS
ncbi:hypothetical protein PDIG_47160 [Penicillium digitatum PHI26]|uniref:Uncharacterized protein n=2 Tax=Penicillium digitatum TaxID=36651 RepID=K9GFE6_PEND2|nr:hypothetical protein PDIP_16340 [Penicillium digitatum Pd1]EKV12001.1 hypothetical protein PDIG_47160 [Penicillium digitatum PHI26]EKV20449.1 hypothetical protein PDIP_16340 [Penicillium digitatum Pd1]